MTAGLGEAAAFGATCTWGISNQVNSAVARRVGSTSVSLLRLPYMVVLITTFCLVFGADTAITTEAALLLFLSGVLGVAVTDMLVYKAVLIIGPTMSLLVLSMSSGLTAIIGWMFLGETLPPQAVLGIFVSLSGVALVVTEHSGSILLPGQAIPRGKTLAFGVCLAAIGAVALAGGYIAQRMGMQTGVQPLWASFVRITTAGVAFWIVGLAVGWGKTAIRDLVEHRPVRRLLTVSCTSATAGMWFASTALAFAPAGVAATIIGLQPIVVAIIGAVWYRKMPSLRVFVGAAIAFSGTALICLR